MVKGMADEEGQNSGGAMQLTQVGGWMHACMPER